MTVSKSEVLAQSKNAYNQWCEQWRAHAAHHRRYVKKPLHDFANTGIGRAVLCIANGYSFEQNLETIKANRQHVDILCCDKSLGHCLDNGIVPDFCLVCDANVNYERYLAPWKDRLQDTVMFQNVCGNPKWTDLGNWKDRYFFANIDVLGSEKEFMKLSECPNAIPAATNVSNAMVVFLSQSDNGGRKNFFGYDKILLIGFDYSWSLKGKYYAFDESGNGKHNYMRHLQTIGLDDEYRYTSQNLIFSARWLEHYVTAFRLPVVQCSRASIFGGVRVGDLAAEMSYSFRPEDRDAVKKLLADRPRFAAGLREIDTRLAMISRDHQAAAFSGA